MSDYEVIEPRLRMPKIVPYAIQRPRIDKLINEGFKKKLLLILGSSGSGKTTAVLNYINNYSVKRFAYLRLSKQETDFNVFSAYLSEALKKSLGESIPLGKFIDEADKSYLLSVYLANRMAKLKKDFYLILDDFQNVEKSGDLLKFLNPLLSSSIPKFHMIIISRRKPELKVEKMILNGDGMIITEKNLRFNREEIETVLRHFKPNCEDNDIEVVLRDTEGWPMGVAAAAKIISQGKKISVQDYKWLFEEIFNSLDKDTRILLLKISPLSAVYPSTLKNYLSKREVLLLEKLSNNGLFMYKIPQGYKLHSLFRAFLKSEFERNPNKDLLLKKLANSLRHEDPIKSMLFYIEAGDFSAAEEIAEANNCFSGTVYGYETIKNLVRRIPFNEIKKMPHIALMQAEVFARENNPEGVISIVKRIISESSDKRIVFKALSLEMEVMLRRGRYGDVIRLANKIYKTLNAVPAKELVSFYYSLAKAYYFSGKLADAEKIVKMLVEELNTIESPFKRAQILDLYGIIFEFRRGNFENAKKNSEMLISMLKSFKLAVDPRYYVNCAMAEMELGEFSEAENDFREAYDITDKLFWKERLPDIDVEYGFLCLMRNELEKASELFEKVEKLSLDNPFVLASLYMGKSILFRKLGKFREALLEAEKDLELTRLMSGKAMFGESLENIAKIYIAKGDFETAVECLEKAYPLLKKGKDAAFVANLKLMRKIALSEPIAETISDIKSKGYIGMLALDSDIIGKYTGDKDSLKIAVKTFGMFKVFVNGNPIEYKEFRRKGIFTFFKFLVANYPGFVSMDKIIDNLYPKLLMRSAKHNVYVAVSVINKLFKSKGVYGVILKKSNMYGINPEIVQSVDFVRFETLIKEGKLREAIELYKGDFIEENLYDDWSMDKREYLANLYINSLLNLSEMENGVNKERILKKVLEKDELNEEALYRLIKYYIDISDTGKALKLCKEAKEKFKEEYGLPLPDKIKKLIC